MRAHTITTITNGRSRANAGQRAAIALLAVLSLVVPATASASPVGSSGFGEDNSTYSSVSAITGQPTSPADDSTVADSGYSSLSAITGQPTSPADGSAVADSGYSSLSAITGAPASEPTLVSGGLGGPADGFDWGSAAVGAGAVLAMVALGSAALLTARRRTAAEPSTI